MGIGDYVRTKYGIEKIKIIEKDFLEKGNTFIATDNDLWRGAYNGKYNGFTIRSGIIIKSSPNIIDLIEENDYIRLQDRGDTYYQVVEVPWSRGRNILAIEDRGWDELEEIYDKEEIISVITHEQMKSMEYEVK